VALSRSFYAGRQTALGVASIPHSGDCSLCALCSRKQLGCEDRLILCAISPGYADYQMRPPNSFRTVLRCGERSSISAGLTTHVWASLQTGFTHASVISVDGAVFGEYLCEGLLVLSVAIL